MFTKRRKDALQAMLSIGADAKEARLVARHARVVTASAGQQICSIGNWERKLFVVLKGSVTCLRADKESFDVSSVGVVGELSVLGVQMFQVADVTCEEGTVLLELNGNKYSSIEGACPVLSDLVQAALEKSSKSVDEARDKYRKRQYEQYEAIAALQNWVRHTSPDV